MTRKRKQLVRVIAVILAVLLGVGTIVAAVISVANAEVAESYPRDQYTFTIEYLEEEQALRVSQRLVYTNKTSDPMDRVIFYALGNMFRRESALMYESDDLEAFFPDGYVPGGIELNEVKVNSESADWGFQGEDELYLRVACALQPGESCTFEFDYYLLLTRNRAFLGLYETDCRLSAFYFMPGMWNDSYNEFLLNKPLAFTRFLYTDAADYELSIALDPSMLLASSGSENVQHESDGRNLWTVSAENQREFAFSFGKRYREDTAPTQSGTQLRCLTNVRGASQTVLKLATEAINAFEEWFGPFPVGQVDFVQSDLAKGFLNFPGCVWLSGELLENGDSQELRRAIRFSLAQQYFGMAAYTEPSADAWLSDALCEYLSYLLIEKSEGHEAYLEALNERLVPALQLTVPGGLTVTSDAALFNANDFELVVLDRGAAVFHELRTSTELDTLLDALARFYEMGLASDTALSEMDFVAALDAVSGKSWEKFLTDWVFNIGDYVEQDIDWLD